jgi:glucose/mannose-6-phosphate isomerase
VSDPPYLDTLGLWDAAAALPEQLSVAFETARDALESLGPPDVAAVRTVAAFGLGTGGTACEAVAALGAPHLRVPFWLGHGPEVPAFVDAHSLVFAVSSSGGTEETLAAAAEAVARGARVVAVGGDADGALARLAHGAALSWCPAAGPPAPEGGRGTPGAPRARAALAAVTVPLLVALSRTGLAPDCAPSVDAAAAALARRRDALLAPAGAAQELARRIGRTIPLVYGSSGVAAVAARWWKARVNLNAKAPAFAAVVPELTYDELAGWGQGGDVTRQTMSLVLLRHAGEGAGAGELFAAVRAATEEVMADVLEIRAEGDDDLGRFFDLALLGELVSLHLAGHEGVDPGPAPAVEEAHGGGGRAWPG